MRISGLLGLATLIVAVAGEVCQSCPNNDLLAVNFTIPGGLDKILVAGDPDDSDSPSDVTVTPAPDAYYDHCKQKGCALEWSMQHSNSEAGAQFAPPRMTAQSPFQTPQDLRDWGWHDGVKISQAYDDLSSFWWGADVALKGLQLPWKTDAQEGPNRLTIIVHQDPTADISVDKQTYNVDGKKYRASDADYTMLVNLQDGVIIAISRKGPDTAGKEREPPLKPEDMPKLHQFSDVGWIKWKAMTEANNLPVNNLRYFLSLGIANTQTLSVCERIFRDNNLAMRRWPGHVFLAGTWQFRAILGTPNVQGFGYMLVQHKADLGNMFISKIHVFLCENNEVCIVAFVSQPVATPVQDAMVGSIVISDQVDRRDEGSNVMRLHKIFAKL